MAAVHITQIIVLPLVWSGSSVQGSMGLTHVKKLNYLDTGTCVHHTRIVIHLQGAVTMDVPGFVKRFFFPSLPGAIRPAIRPVGSVCTHY